MYPLRVRSKRNHDQPYAFCDACKSETQTKAAAVGRCEFYIVHRGSVVGFVVRASAEALKVTPASKVRTVYGTGNL
jgi:hypothetical protein